MARKRKADHDTAVAAALELFWAQGYGGASTREIEEKTGLTRFTLQTAYGGKEGFFLDTLDAYLDRAEAHSFPDPETFDLDALAAWFEQLAGSKRIPAIDQTGCLAFNSVSEFGRDNREVNARIERYLGSFEARVRRILQRAVADGQMRDINTEQMARVLVDLLLGLHVVIKARSDDSMAQKHAKSIAALIRGWKKNGGARS